MAARFSKASIEALAHAKMIGVRAGTAHKYTGVWVVVVEGRVFVRSWNDKPTGWFRAFLDEPAGSIQFADVERKVRATPTRSQRLQDAVSAAYGEKVRHQGITEVGARLRAAKESGEHARAHSTMTRT